jgi:hypothetical protein
VDKLIKKIQTQGLTVVDSWTRSMVLGRVAGPIFWTISAVLYFGFGIVIDESTAQQLTKLIADLLVWACAAWGTVAPIWSKARQKQSVAET